MYRFHEIEDALCVGQKFGGCEDERVVLFLKMKEGNEYNDELVMKVKKSIVSHLSMRHVPHFFYETKVCLPMDIVPQSVR